MKQRGFCSEIVGRLFSWRRLQFHPLQIVCSSTGLCASIGIPHPSIQMYGSFLLYAPSLIKITIIQPFPIPQRVEIPSFHRNISSAHNTPSKMDNAKSGLPPRHERHVQHSASYIEHPPNPKRKCRRNARCRGNNSIIHLISLKMQSTPHPQEEQYRSSMIGK